MGIGSIDRVVETSIIHRCNEWIMDSLFFLVVDSLAFYCIVNSLTSLTNSLTTIMAIKMEIRLLICNFSQSNNHKDTSQTWNYLDFVYNILNWCFLNYCYYTSSGARIPSLLGGSSKFVLSLWLIFIHFVSLNILFSLVRSLFSGWLCTFAREYSLSRTENVIINHHSRATAF